MSISHEEQIDAIFNESERDVSTSDLVRNCGIKIYTVLSLPLLSAPAST